MKVFVQYEMIKIYYLTCSNVSKRGCVGAVFQDMLSRLYDIEGRGNMSIMGMHFYVDIFPKKC